MLDFKVTDTKTGLVMPDPRTGKPNQDSRKSESFVQQFMQILYLNMQYLTTAMAISIRDTSNTLRNAYMDSYIIWRCDGPINDTTYGIVVGTGAVAPTISDYALGTLIAHGGGAGQLQYGAVSFGAPASDATTSQFTITRNFANASGGGITVNEIGLYNKFYDGDTRYAMLIRDVVGGGILVPNGQTLTVNYRPQVVL
jgi:hypothetical protein